MQLDIKKMEISTLILDTIPVAVTVTDPEGRIVYFNKYSSEILDRKPEYVGMDIRQCHKMQGSIEKIDHIFSQFKSGKDAPFYYEATREGTLFAVTVLPLRKSGQFIGCVHSVVIKSKSEGG